MQPAWSPLRFTGRLGRGQYIVLQVLYLVGMVLVATIMGSLFSATNPNSEGMSELGAVGTVLYVTSLIVLFPFYVGFFSVSVRRLHDTDRSGWTILYGLIPIVNILILLYLLFAPGTPDANRYGDREPLFGDSFGETLVERYERIHKNSPR